MKFLFFAEVLVSGVMDTFCWFGKNIPTLGPP